MPYNEAVDIERLYETISDSGALIQEWKPRWPGTWAAVEFLQGREFWSGAQLLIERIVVFRFRYTPNFAAMTPGQYRVAYQGRTYEINSIIPVDDRKNGRPRVELHVRCVQND